MLYGNVVAVTPPRRRLVIPQPLPFPFDACRLHTVKYSTSAIHIAYFYSWSAFFQSKCCTDESKTPKSHILRCRIYLDWSFFATPSARKWKMCEYSRYATCNKLSISIGASIVGYTHGASVEAAVLPTIWHATWDVYFLENIPHFSVNWVLFFGWKRTNTQANSSPRHRTRISPEVNRNRKPVSVFSFWSWTVDASIYVISNPNWKKLRCWRWGLLTTIRTIEHLRCSTRSTSSALKIHSKSILQFSFFFIQF